MPVKKAITTRYGPDKRVDRVFGTEERFRWQKAQFTSDVVYALPSTIMTRASQFGTGFWESRQTQACPSPSLVQEAAPSPERVGA